LDREGAEKQKPFCGDSYFTVPELTRIVRVVGDHVPIKVRFSFIHDSIAEMALFSISRLVKLCA